MERKQTASERHNCLLQHMGSVGALHPHVLQQRHGSILQGGAKEMAPGCETVLLECAWLVLSKTGTFFYMYKSQ